MEPNDRTPTGEESSRRGRPPVRLAPKPALGATARLGGEVAAARAPGRVLRAATRLSPPRPGTPSAPAPEQEIARSAAEPPAPVPAPAVSDTPVGMEDWHAAWIFEGDAQKAITMSEEAIAREPDAKPGRAKLQRSRGARIVEGRASGMPEPTPPSASVAREAAEPTLPPIPGADVVPETPAAARKRVSRSPAGSARSEPVPDSPTPHVQPPSIMRSASKPVPAREAPAPTRSEGERPAPVRMELRRREPAPQSVPVRPRMQRATRGSVQRPAAPVADIVVAPPAAERGVFRRAIDALTGRGPASVEINPATPGPTADRWPGLRRSRSPIGERAPVVREAVAVRQRPPGRPHLAPPRVRAGLRAVVVRLAVAAGYRARSPRRRVAGAVRPVDPGADPGHPTRVLRTRPRAGARPTAGRRRPHAGLGPWLVGRTLAAGVRPAVLGRTLVARVRTVVIRRARGSGGRAAVVGRTRAAGLRAAVLRRTLAAGERPALVRRRPRAGLWPVVRVIGADAARPAVGRLAARRRSTARSRPPRRCRRSTARSRPPRRCRRSTARSRRPSPRRR